MQYPGRPGSPGNPITNPGFPSSDPQISDIVAGGGYVRTNREREGAWQGYLNALRKTPDYSAGNATFFETPADRKRNGGQTPGGSGIHVKPYPGGKRSTNSERTPTRGGGYASVANYVSNTPGTPAMATPTSRYSAAQEAPAGTPEANYTAGIRRYGAGMRSAPNVGAVSNKGGYNERDRKLAAQRGASLATGDALSRVRTLGG